MNQLDFRNRRAVVTGGAAGIGLAVATRLVASGARVALWDRDERALAQRARSGRRRHGDARARCRRSAMRSSRGRATAAAALGGIDVLVCSAGITGPERDDVGLPGGRVAPGVRRQRARPLLLQPRGRADHAHRRTTGASSTSRRSPARKATPTRRPTARRRPRSSASRSRSARSSRRPDIRVNCVTPAAVKHRDLRPDDAAAHRLHAVEDPDGPLRQRRRDRGDGVLARVARIARSRPARCSTCRAAAPTY